MNTGRAATTIDLARAERPDLAPIFDRMTLTTPALPWYRVVFEFAPGTDQRLAHEAMLHVWRQHLPVFVDSTCRCAGDRCGDYDLAAVARTVRGNVVHSLRGTAETQEQSDEMRAAFDALVIGEARPGVLRVHFLDAGGFSEEAAHAVAVGATQYVDVTGRTHGEPYVNAFREVECGCGGDHRHATHVPPTYDRCVLTACVEHEDCEAVRAIGEECWRRAHGED